MNASNESRLAIRESLTDKGQTQVAKALRYQKQNNVDEYTRATLAVNGYAELVDLLDNLEIYLHGTRP